MRLRCCVLVCAFSAAALAQSTEAYFGKAFKQALPSPFVLAQPAPGGKVFVQPGIPDGTLLPKLLPQPRAFVAGPDQCAIPLAQTPISKDRQFLIRKLPQGDASRLDPMAAPAIPVCRQ